MRCANYNNPSCPKIADATKYVNITSDVRSDFPSNLTTIKSETKPSTGILLTQFALCDTCTSVIINLAKGKQHKVLQPLDNSGFVITSKNDNSYNKDKFIEC